MTPEEAIRLLHLYATAPSLDDAAAEVGISRRGLLRWVQRLRADPRWRDRIPERTGRRGHVPPPPGEVQS